MTKVTQKHFSPGALDYDGPISANYVAGRIAGFSRRAQESTKTVDKPVDNPPGTAKFTNEGCRLTKI